MTRPVVVAATGASGSVYFRRLCQVLVQSDRPVHLSLSPSAMHVMQQELGYAPDLRDFDPRQLQMDVDPSCLESIQYYDYRDFLAPMASGSFLTAGMVICPCSGGTLSGVAHGTSANLIQRAAEVHLKERRTLILVPRETPLSLVHLDNLRTAHLAGAVILPAAPGWYHGVKALEDLVDFVVARILDQLEIDHQLMQRWGSEDEPERPSGSGNELPGR